MDTITLIVKCPHCGAEKKVASSKERWYNLHYTFWSDSRIESDEFCEPGHTQQCSECGKFFCIPPIKTLPSSEDPCNETGTLPLQSLKKAIEELSGDERAEEWARLEAWWAYNSMYANSDFIPEEEKAYNRTNMQWLVDYYTKNTQRFSHLLFELNRLLGNLDVCRKMIDALTYEEYARQREEKNKERGFVSQLDEKYVRERYDSLIKELKFAMEQPLKPFIKSKQA